MSQARAWLAIVVGFGAGTLAMVVVSSLFTLVQPGSQLVEHDRLPPTWRRLAAWARSRSLRLWCPDPKVAAVIAGHLRTESGRRLRRLGVSMADGPGSADVVVVERSGEADVAAARERVPAPCAAIVLGNADDLDEVVAALVSLSATLRWPGGDSAR